MGETSPKDARQIVGFHYYRLWMSEQLDVIVSRVRDLIDIIFMGKTLKRKLESYLKMFSHWAALTNAIMNSVTSPNAIVSQFVAHPFPSSTVICCKVHLSLNLYNGSTITLKRMYETGM